MSRVELLDRPWIPAEWPAPSNVHAGTTTRQGGSSAAPYDSLNLAEHVGDAPFRVAANRKHIQRALALPGSPRCLRQRHGTRIVDPSDEGVDLEADGACTAAAGIVCVVLTADCLPVLLCDRPGRRIAALHCGWRGLAGGILGLGVARMGVASEEIMAWLGPAIGPAAYEVGEEVRSAFLALGAELDSVFQAGRTGHWHLDLYATARILLRASGVCSIYGAGRCTYSEAAHFFSHRREGVTGRTATLIWRELGTT